MTSSSIDSSGGRYVVAGRNVREANATQLQQRADYGVHQQQQQRQFIEQQRTQDPRWSRLQLEPPQLSTYDAPRAVPLYVPTVVGAGAAGAGAAGEGAEAGAGAFAQGRCRAAVGRCTKRGRTADGPRAKSDFSAKTDIKRGEEFGYAGIQRQDGQLWCTVCHEPVSNHRHKVISHINTEKHKRRRQRDDLDDRRTAN
jgi:hypothetical protein